MLLLHPCLYILNIKSDDISQSHQAFNIIQTSRNSYSMSIWWTTMNGEWQLFMQRVQIRRLNKSVNLWDFGCAENCGIPTTFEFGFKFRHILTTSKNKTQLTTCGALAARLRLSFATSCSNSSATSLYDVRPFFSTFIITLIEKWRSPLPGARRRRFDTSLVLSSTVTKTF